MIIIELNIFQTNSAEARDFSQNVKDIDRAIKHAINRTIESAKTELIRETVRLYYVSATDIRKTITLKISNSSGIIQGLINSRGERIKLSAFKVSPKTISRRMNGKSYQAAVKREGGMKRLSPNSFYIPSHKMLRMRYSPGGRGFQHTRALFGPAIPQILKNEQTLDAVRVKADNVFNERLEHELKRLNLL